MKQRQPNTASGIIFQERWEDGPNLSTPSGLAHLVCLGHQLHHAQGETLPMGTWAGLVTSRGPQPQTHGQTASCRETPSTRDRPSQKAKQMWRDSSQSLKTRSQDHVGMGCYGAVAKSCLTHGTPWTVTHQAPPSMGFSRQEYWSGVPFPSPGESSWPRDETRVSCIAGGLLAAEPPGKPMGSDAQPLKL